MGVRLGKNVEKVEDEQTGVIRSGWLADIWTVPDEDDEPEYLVDCN